MTSERRLFVATIDRDRLTTLLRAEQELYVERHPGSLALYQQAGHLFGGVPMTWMSKWSGGFPLYLDHAHAARIVDVDGNAFVDFALGDTGAMAGHSPQATIAAVHHRIGDLGGITTMLPTADAEWVGAELTRRFGLPLWSFTLSATDANRWAIRLARLVTGKPKIIVFNYCYHGSVDEAFAIGRPDGTTVSREGNVAPPTPLDVTTRAVEFNDLAAVERALAHGDVAAILTEPALTNIGIVLPDPGFLEGLRELATKYGALLMIDETHTISVGPGGATAAWGLEPDIFIIGKSIGGGIPSGAYGLSQEVADRISAMAGPGGADIVDVGGVGGTLAGNAMSVAAMRATLEHVLTDAAWPGMIELATLFTDDVAAVIAEHDLPWSVTQLGARAEYRFTSPAPRTGTESHDGDDEELEEFLHLFCANRGVLITPFHNMALMCPETTRHDVDRHTDVFTEAIRTLVS